MNAITREDIVTLARFMSGDNALITQDDSLPFAGFDLIGANLRGADLSYANLRVANLRGADLRDANLRDANLRGADLSYANLRGADLRGADLSYADLRDANLRGADLRVANLRGANLSYANLRVANLRGADLSYANLRGADLSYADLSGSSGLLRASEWMRTTLEKAPDGGYYAYKTFGGEFASPDTWVIEIGAVIDEVPNPLPTDGCGCGVNVGTLEWVKSNYPNGQIYKLHIRAEWLPDVAIPYNTTGKFRCAIAEIVALVER